MVNWTKVIGAAIYTGTFILCSVLFDWRLAMIICLFIWGNNWNNKLYK